MATPIASTDQIEQTRTLQNKDKYRLDWPGWALETPPVTENSAKRRRIVDLLEDKTVGINPIPIKKKDLEKIKEITYFNISGRCVVTGIAYVRAYYDATINTGEIKCGHPVVFDTVTGSSVTGINVNWASDEYFTVGISMVNFNLVQPYQDYKNIIQVKLSNPPGESGTGHLLYTGSNYRIPGRFYLNGKAYSGAYNAYKVEVIKTTINGFSAYELKPSTSTVVALHPGRRDLRPSGYCFANKDNDSGLYIITSEMQ
jgi:hypothetical protein